jgi:hypothetical protein
VFEFLLTETLLKCHRKVCLRNMNSSQDKLNNLIKRRRLHNDERFSQDLLFHDVVEYLTTLKNLAQKVLPHILFYLNRTHMYTCYTRSFYWLPISRKNLLLIIFNGKNHFTTYSGIIIAYNYRKLCRNRKKKQFQG